MLKSLTCILLIFSNLVYGHVNLDRTDEVSELRIEVIKSFDVINARTGARGKISPKGDVKVRVIGKNKWAYRIRIERNGIDSGKEYLVDKKWLKKALNMQAAYNAMMLQRTVDDATNSPTGECNDQNDDQFSDQQDDSNTDANPDSDNEPTFEVVVADDLFEDPAPIVTSNKQWKPGCNVLGDRKTLDPSNSDQYQSLKKCIRSIQNSVTRNGTISDRGRIFRNLYKYLRPEEQHFAAMIFTAYGESAILVQDKSNPEVNHLEEPLMVMKVINNRVRNANEDRTRRGQGQNMNALDIALDPWQFSMYNANEPGWKRTIQPGYGANFNNMIKAYMKFNHSKFQPDPQINHVYHYHANYMLPSDSAWGKGFRANHKRLELAVTVDGKSLREAPAGLDEGNASDRNKIARNWRLWRHRFYLPIDTKGQVKANGDNWYWTVRRPFRS
jgi:hypothetical protein